MSDMAATACGRRWPLLPTTLECGAGAARVRLPAFVDVNYDVFSVSRRGFASPGARAALLALPCAVGELDCKKWLRSVCHFGIGQ